MKIEKNLQIKWNLWSEVPDIKQILNYTRTIFTVATVSY